MPARQVQQRQRRRSPKRASARGSAGASSSRPAKPPAARRATCAHLPPDKSSVVVGHGRQLRPSRAVARPGECNLQRDSQHSIFRKLTFLRSPCLEHRTRHRTLGDAVPLTRFAKNPRASARIMMSPRTCRSGASTQAGGGRAAASTHADWYDKAAAMSAAMRSAGRAQAKAPSGISGAKVARRVTGTAKTGSRSSRPMKSATARNAVQVRACAGKAGRILAKRVRSAGELIGKVCRSSSSNRLGGSKASQR